MTPSSAFFARVVALFYLCIFSATPAWSQHQQATEIQTQNAFRARRLGSCKALGWCDSWLEYPADQKDVLWKETTSKDNKTSKTCIYGHTSEGLTDGLCELGCDGIKHVCHCVSKADASAGQSGAKHLYTALGAGSLALAVVFGVLTYFVGKRENAEEDEAEKQGKAVATESSCLTVVFCVEYCAIGCVLFLVGGVVALVTAKGTSSEEYFTGCALAKDV